MRRGFREGMLFKKILSLLLFGVMTLPVLKERKNHLPQEEVTLTIVGVCRYCSV